MRGQAAFEYMTVFLLFLLALLPVVYFAFDQFRINSRIYEARTAVNTLTRTADKIYAQGPGSQAKVSLYLPGGINSEKTYIGGKEVNLNVFISSNRGVDVYSTSDAMLSGSLPSKPGRYPFTVKCRDDGVVEISYT